MQGTVYRYDADSGDGSLLLDDGQEVPFGGAEVDDSGLRHLRPGQRLTIEVREGRVARMRILGIGPGESIR